MAKPGIHGIPPVALLHCGRGMEDGVVKYGLTNWRENSVSAAVYYNAAFRHLASWWDGEQNAADSGVHHLGHVMACCAIILDAEAGGNLIDDRPAVPGTFAEAVKAMTRAMEPLTADEESVLDEIVAMTAPRTRKPFEMADEENDIAPERKPFEVPSRAPAQAGGPLDPDGNKTQEIRHEVKMFLEGQTGAGDRHEDRAEYVYQWLDDNGYQRVSQVGSIRDQAALYDHIDRYVAA